LYQLNSDLSGKTQYPKHTSTNIISKCVYSLYYPCSSSSCDFNFPI